LRSDEFSFFGTSCETYVFNSSSLFLLKSNTLATFFGDLKLEEEDPEKDIGPSAWSLFWSFALSSFF